MTRSFLHTEILNTHTHTHTHTHTYIYIYIALKRKYKRVPITENIHTLFYEQAVSRRGSKTQNALFNDDGK